MWKRIVFSAALVIACYGQDEDCKEIEISESQDENNLERVEIGECTKFGRNVKECVKVKTKSDCSVVALNCYFHLEVETDACKSTFLDVLMKDDTFVNEGIVVAGGSNFTLRANVFLRVVLEANDLSHGGELDCWAWCDSKPAYTLVRSIQAATGSYANR